MKYFHIEIEIQAPPDVVWTVMRDVEHWPEWTPTVRSVRLLGGKRLAAGSRALIRQPKLPPAVWQVSEVDEPGRSFTWVSGAPGVRVAGRHWVEPSGESSRANLSLTYSGVFGGLLVFLTGTINDQYLALEADGLKARSEGIGRAGSADRKG